jgi:chromosomal replication initiation ATPase DnaA
MKKQYVHNQQLEDILSLVSAKTAVPIDLIKSKERDDHAKVARQMYCYLAVKKTTCTLPQIASLVNRDHATVIHAIKVINGKMPSSRRTREIIEQNSDLLELQTNTDRINFLIRRIELDSKELISLLKHEHNNAKTKARKR